LLPPSPVQFVGRRIRVFLALRYLRRREHEARVLAISGMPGVGKTALALVLARQLRQSSYPDNQLFIQLSGGREPAMSSRAALFEALVQLKVPATVIAAHDGRWRQLYLETLQGTRSLVILDNASNDQQVLDLWPPDRCAGIVTCRVELSQAIVNGVRPVRLQPLSTLQALRMLANRIGDRWRVARQPVSALRLVGLYGRLPLALGFVSARLAAGGGHRPPLRAVLGRLNNPRLRLAFVSAGADMSIARALDVSYQALIEEQQRAFCVFGLLHLPELDDEVVAAVLQTDTYRARRLLNQVVAVGLLEVAGRLGDRWYAHELGRLFATVMVEYWPEAARRAARQRAIEVYAHRINNFQDLHESPLKTLDPKRWAAEQARLETELASRYQLVREVVDQAAHISMNFSVSLAREFWEFLFEFLTSWPDPASDDDANPVWVRPPRQPPGGTQAPAAGGGARRLDAPAQMTPRRPPPWEFPPTGPAPDPSARSGRPPTSGPAEPKGKGLPGGSVGGPGAAAAPPPSNRYDHRVRRHWVRPASTRRQWRITGGVFGFRTATVYIDGKKVAKLPEHRLIHLELVVQSDHPPAEISFSGTRGPDDPPPSGSFSVQELPPR
jgi:DNA polymerase III delta prime subunit